MSDASLQRRALKAGLVPEWIDAGGHPRAVSAETLRTVLNTLNGYEIGDAKPAEDVRCFSIRDIDPERRFAGLAVQLYSLRGSNGFGDLGALARLASEAAPLGIDAVAVSPLHAPFLAANDGFSPYAPSSRLFLNPLYAAENVPDDGEDSFVDWQEASRAKIARLRRSFAHQATNGDVKLRDHARFEALDAHFRAQGLHRWQDWPPAYRCPASAEVERFARERWHDVEFHIALQIRAEESLAAAQTAARNAGMAIGLITDIAIGVCPHGSDAWSGTDDLLRGLTIGAPPDIFNPQGQNWGLTTLSPAARPEAFTQIWDAAMDHAGGVRIDHAMGLRRLWVIPEGAGPKEGVYLHYPMQSLLALLAECSQRHRAIVVGEDLGTVPDGFRDAMGQADILGMEVLWFQRGGRRFLPAEHWSKHAVGLTTTHDLPTVAGWWRGRDIDWLEKLGRKSEHGDVGAERWARGEDRTHLWSAVAHGPEPSPVEPQKVVEAVLAFVGRTPCDLAIAPLEDMLGISEQPNIPGTIDEHPNWRRRLPPGDALASTEVRANLAAFLRGRSQA